MYIRTGRDQTSNGRVAELPDEYGVTMAHIAPAWLLDQGGVDAPIVGTTSVDHDWLFEPRRHPLLAVERDIEFVVGQ